MLRRALVLLLVVVERLPLQRTDTWGRGLALHAMLDLHGCAGAVMINRVARNQTIKKIPHLLE